MPCMNVNNRQQATKYNLERKKKKPWMLLHYATWCGHCNAMKDDWSKFEKQNKENINIARINADMIKEGHVKTDAEVNGFPAINFVDGMGEIVDYEGDRSVESLNDFARNNMKRMNGGRRRTKRKTRSKRNNHKRKNTRRRHKRNKRKSNNNVRYYKGGGILDSIETKLQRLENMIGSNTFE